MNTSSIHIIITGGTIAAQIQPNGTYGTPTLSEETLLAGIPETWKKQIQIHSLSLKISHNENLQDYLALRNLIEKMSHTTSRILVLTGTNMLPVKAFYQSLVTTSNVRIVFTGADYPHGSPDYDGWQNIMDSLYILQSPWPEKIRTVCVFHHKIFAPYACYKGKTAHHALTLHYYPEGELGQIQHNQIIWNTSIALPAYFDYQENFSNITQLPWIPIYYDHPGAEKTLDLLLKEKPAGIVVVGAAEGFINETSLTKICTLRIPVMRTSSIAGVFVKWRKNYDDRYHTLPAHTLSPAQAQLLMSFIVGAGIDFPSLFWQSLTLLAP